MLVSQKGAPRKHQEMVTFIKGSGAGGGGSWIFTENMKILETLRKRKNLENSQKWEFSEIAECQKTEICEIRDPSWDPKGTPPELTTYLNTVRNNICVFLEFRYHLQ